MTSFFSFWWNFILSQLCGIVALGFWGTPLRYLPVAQFNLLPQSTRIFKIH